MERIVEFPIIISFLCLFGMHCQSQSSEMPCSAGSCGSLPTGLKLVQKYSLIDIVKASPIFELMNPNSTIASGFTAGCNTYVSLDGNNTFINFRVAVYKNGSRTLRTFLVREIRRGSVELAGFTETYGAASRVAYESTFALACPEGKDLILGLIRTFCYASDCTEEPYYYTVSLRPRPSPCCVKQINNTIISISNCAGLNVPTLFQADYSKPFKCVTKFNGLRVINAHSIPKENSIELKSLNFNQK